VILFDITPGQLSPCNDKPRTATMNECAAYIRWLAETRGICITGCDISESGAWRGKGSDAVCVLPMPGYGVQPHVICELLDDDGT